MKNFEELSEEQGLDGSKVELKPDEIAVVVTEDEKGNVKVQGVTNNTSKKWYVKLWDIVRPQGKIDQVKNKIIVKNIHVIADVLGLPSFVPEIVGYLDKLNDEYFGSKGNRDEDGTLFLLIEDESVYETINDDKMKIPWIKLSELSGNEVATNDTNLNEEEEEEIQEIQLNNYLSLPNYIFEFVGLEE